MNLSRRLRTTSAHSALLFLGLSASIACSPQEPSREREPDYSSTGGQGATGGGMASGGSMVGGESSSGGTTGSGGGSGSGGQGEAGGSPPVDVGPEWSLVWADEFDVDGPIDEERWNFEVQDPGWVNDELQAYTTDSRNVRVEGGVLVLEAHRESGDNPSYTSGRVHSSGKGDVLYGRVDVRAKLPEGVGSWPAIWMFPTWPWQYGGWPDSGEIDIMEHVGHDLGVVHASVHTEAYNWPSGSQKTDLTQVPTASTQFHVYSLQWEESELRASVDGVVFFTFENEGTGSATWPFDQPFHIILNVAVGGIWGGAEGVDEDAFPLHMEVDYVRVYEPAN